MKGLRILEFIHRREIISAQDLIDGLGYSEGGAYSWLGYLKQQKLVINDRRGEWTLTDAGLKRLIYYGRVK